MNQAELRALAEERILDAKALLDAGRWGFAYYVAGYAVECALKSCVLSRMIYTGLVFREKFDAKECRTHGFEKLVELAGLRDALEARLKQSSADRDEFRLNWPTALEWEPGSRYAVGSEAEAKRLYDAITQDPHGVLIWTQTYW